MKFDTKKLLSVSNIVYLVAIVATLVGLIFYGVNTGAEGYYQGVKADGLVVSAIFAIVLMCLNVCASTLELDAKVEKIVSVVKCAAVVGATVLLVIALIALVASRVEGLAYIYGADENIKAEIQTAANMASASSAIAGMVTFAIAWVVSVVASFFKN